GDVAADAASAMRSRIRGVVVTVRREPAGYFRVDHARFDLHPAVLEVDFDDAFHPRKDDEDTLRSGQRTAREPGPRSAGNYRQPVRVRDLHYLDDFGSGPREDHHAGDRAKARQPIALVSAQLLR